MRTLIAAAQIAAGLLVLINGVLHLIQSWVNLPWEVGFYTEASPVGAALLLRALILIGLGASTSLLGLGDAQLGLSGQWILFSCLFRMCVVPEPIAWVLLAASMLVVWERFDSLRSQPRA